MQSAVSRPSKWQLNFGIGFSVVTQLSMRIDRITETRGGLMVSALVSRSSGPGSGPGPGDIVLCSWARHFTLTVPLTTQVYKWVPGNLRLGGNPAMD